MLRLWLCGEENGSATSSMNTDEICSVGDVGDFLVYMHYKRGAGLYRHVGRISVNKYGTV